MTKTECFVSWLFGSNVGPVVGILLLPVGLLVWAVASLILGEDLFESRWWAKLENHK